MAAARSRLYEVLLGPVERYLGSIRTPPNARQGVGTERKSGSSSSLRSSSTVSEAQSNTNVYFEYLNRQALRRTAGRSKTTRPLELNLNLFNQYARWFAKDAAEYVFLGRRPQSDPSFERAIQLIRSFRSNSSKSVLHSTLKIPKRPSFAKSQNAVIDIGLQSSRRGFHSGHMGFENFVTNAPLILRAYAGEVEDDLRYYSKKRGSLKRSRLISPSSRSSSSSSYEDETDSVCRPKKVKRAIEAQENVGESSFSSFTDQMSSFDVVSRELTTAVETVTPESQSQIQRFQESSEYSNYFAVVSPQVERPIGTYLKIPTMIDTLLLIEFSTMKLPDDGHLLMHDDVLLSVAKTKVNNRVTAIEHAFDTEPLRAFRPKIWKNHLRVNAVDPTQPPFLYIPFPGCSPEQVREMLSRSLSETNAEYYSSLVFSNGIVSSLPETSSSTQTNDDSASLQSISGNNNDWDAQSDECVHLSDSIISISSNISSSTDSSLDPDSITEMSRAIILDNSDREFQIESNSILESQFDSTEMTGTDNSQGFIFPVIDLDENQNFQYSFSP